MKLITTTDRRRLPFRTPALEGSMDGRTHLRARLHRAQHWAEAIEKYEAAVEIYRTGGCRLREIERTAIARWKRTEPLAEAAPAPPSRQEGVDAPSMASAVSCRDWAYWPVGFQDGESFVKDHKGLRYVADVLRRPGIETHALNLVRAGRRSADPVLVNEADQLGATIGWRPSSDYRRPAGNAGPMLDRQAKAEYPRRFADLRQELEAAEAHGDDQRASRVEEKTRALQRELRRAAGLGGRQRFAADATERARVNVARTLRLAPDRLEEVSPDLGRRLD